MKAKKKTCQFLAYALLPLLLLAVLCPLAATAGDDDYSPEELEEIVAPIALYPDIIISSMLPASTVPNDVVEAARWAGEQDGEITEPPKDSGWDPAVEAMVQFPDVLTWMSENLDWLEMLAFAVQVQQEQVLEAIQDFRAKAQDAGNLESNEQMQVIQDSSTEVIQIQPAQPSVVYVPTYDPYAVVRPGYRWPAFGVGVAVGAMGAWAMHGIGWGHHGHGGSININNSAHYNFNKGGNINTGNIGSGNNWKSNNRPNQRPSSRPGSTRPGKPNSSSRPGNKGRPAKGGVKPGGAKPGNRPGQRPGDRPNRPGTKPGAGNRPGTGQKPGAGNRPNRPSTKPGAGKPSTRPGTKPGGSKKPTTRPSTKPSTRPSSSNRAKKSSMSGASSHGRTTRQASSRGNQSRSSSSRSRSSGGSRGGGSRGGGSRGGGGRRR